MLKKAFIRIILGVILAFLSAFLSNIYFHTYPLFNIPYIGQIISSLAGWAIGTYLLPLGINALVEWIQRIIFSAIKDTFAQMRHQSQEHAREQRDNERKLNGNPEQVVLDTSAIIDGRIGEILNLGFLPCQLFVPRFILLELQHVADSTDVLKRNRGRRGLDLLNELQKNPDVKIKIIDKDYPHIKTIDAKLVRLAKEMHAKVLTTDYNLNKVAKVSGVQVLNVNELSNALKTVVLPGERIKIKVIQEGKELNQGVGYLPDGTMVVVEEGMGLIGQVIDVEVSRIFQTAAGRMIFVQLVK